MLSRPSDAVLPAGSLVLITGVNGLLGGKMADQLLQLGYRFPPGVRGVVRDSKKAQWLQERFDEAYGVGKFEVVEVPKMQVAGALDGVVKGCSGMLHLVSDISWGPDPNLVITNSKALVLEGMRAAATEPGLRRFVYTSSAAAAMQMRFNEVFDLGPDAWNTASVERALAPPPYTPERAFDVYAASKVQCEQAVWDFVSTQRPRFEANTVLPDFVTGPSLDVARQGLGPTAHVLGALWTGDESFRFLPPHYMVDTGDVGLLHVGALLHPDFKGERVFGYAHRKTWTDWIQRLRAMYPEHKFPDPPENEGQDLSNVIGRPRAESLLKWLGQPGWRPMEESMKEAFDVIAAKYGI
ncbi:NAD-P-binding protein [Apiospora kogelbergensis]|uniref:NAD-P-binding protein n=1 Tax=Apiospora kogelbergensis TaxID=1337665 RepID=UPI00313146B3